MDDQEAVNQLPKEEMVVIEDDVAETRAYFNSV